jgi:hypothetical protein
MNVSLVQRLAILVGALLIGCGARTAPCVAQETCPAGQTCLAGRCSSMGSELAPPDAQRIVVPASEIAVVSSRGNDRPLPSEIPLGRAPNGSIVVLLRFPTPWGNRVRIASAFLTLEPLPGSLPESQAVPVSVARVLDPWSSSDVSWARLPRLSAPEVRALASPSPPKTLRIDVTPIVRRWARGRATDQGLALTAAGEAPAGATYATGVFGAAGPRLDVYLR